MIVRDYQIIIFIKISARVKHLSYIFENQSMHLSCPVNQHEFVQYGPELFIQTGRGFDVQSILATSHRKRAVLVEKYNLKLILLNCACMINGCLEASLTLSFLHT